MQENYEDLKAAARRITGNSSLKEELLHYCIDEFLRKKDLDFILESGGGRWYIVRMMMNQWKSTTSPFYFTYRQTGESLGQEHEDIPEEGEDPLVQEMAEAIQKELKNLPWYDQKLFEIFVIENHTVSSLSRATDIPRTSISLAINRIRRHIINKLNGNI
jgi:DNA-directed RNA polymerase specialized sigma24 family protein